jgi:hypothetical protein
MDPRYPHIARFLASMLELLHTHLGFIFPKDFYLFISHNSLVSYILGENIPPGEYFLSVHTSV